MSKKIIFAVFLFVLALAIVGLTAFTSSTGSNVQLDQKITGSIFAGIEVTTDPVNAVTANRTMLNLYAIGTPGAANIEVVGGVVPAAAPSGLCPEGTDLELKFVDGGFVETFKDHSLLFYALDESPEAKNALCVDFQGPATGTFDYVIIGGAGRFEGATGSATVHVTAWAVTAELSAETGTISGTVHLP